MKGIEDAAQLIAERALKGLQIVSFTGAGISRESGIPTFRGDDGIWQQHDPEDVATLRGFLDDPERAWRFHEQLREICLASEPNPAHLALAWLHNIVNEIASASLITQNIDGLHQAAGSTDVSEIHGSAHRARCVKCEFATDDLPPEFAELPPRCDCGELLRPGVVWFGEQLPADIFHDAQARAEAASVMLVIGTSATVQPAASLPVIAMQAGADLIEINPLPTAFTPVATVRLSGPAGVILPQLAEATGDLLNGRPDSSADTE